MLGQTARILIAIFVAAAWAVTLPLAADALLGNRQTWASFAFVPVALATAGLWWLHVRERSRRVGVAAGMSGWLFIGSLALLGVAGFVWILVAMALIAAAVAYGIVLLVTQQRAPRPTHELVTGLLLFATGGATVIFTLTTGLSQIDAWWVPAHVLLALGIGAATIVGALASPQPPSQVARAHRT